MQRPLVRFIALMALASLWQRALAANINSKKGQNPNLSNRNIYSEEKCEIMHSCKFCSFQEVKQIKECNINTYINVFRCLRVNTNNKDDKFFYLTYEPCMEKSFYHNPAVIFIVVLVLMFFLFKKLLYDFRTRLENQLYERISNKDSSRRSPMSP